jgi:hypothetical protein
LRLGWKVKSANSAAAQIAARLQSQMPIAGERVVTGGGVTASLARRSRSR